MASINFVDNVTVVPASWLNEVDALLWDVFNGKSTAGTSGTILRSNGTNIVNTTATYPTTTTANQLLYSSATNTIGGLTSANSSVLVTNGSGVPSLSTTLPTGLTISGLATDLAISDGGTGQSTATAAFDALAPTTTTGDIIYYNGTDNVRLAVGSTGQVLRVSSGAPSWGSNLTIGTPTATTSGTAVNVTGLPSGIKRITISLESVSTNGISFWILQIGDSGGIENTGYLSGASLQQNAGTNIYAAGTAGYILVVNNSAISVVQMAITLTRINNSSNIWIASYSGNDSGLSASIHGGGTKTLSAELDRFTLTTLGGTDTFDAGQINYVYEF